MIKATTPSRQVSLPKITKDIKPSLSLPKLTKEDTSEVSQDCTKQIPQINWDDFVGPIPQSYWLAYTIWYVKYSYTISTYKGKNYINLTSQCVLNKDKSWVRWRNERLLEHERGHYLIGWICALEFKRRVLERNLSGLLKKTIDYEIKKIFKDTVNEYVKWERLYDEETEHFLDREKQLIWDMKICDRLEGLRKYL